jgi:hypothetical protein
LSLQRRFNGQRRAQKTATHNGNTAGIVVLGVSMASAGPRKLRRSRPSGQGIRPTCFNGQRRAQKTATGDPQRGHWALDGFNGQRRAQKTATVVIRRRRIVHVLFQWPAQGPENCDSPARTKRLRSAAVSMASAGPRKLRQKLDRGRSLIPRAFQWPAQGLTHCDLCAPAGVSEPKVRSCIRRRWSFLKSTAIRERLHRFTSSVHSVQGYKWHNVSCKSYKNRRTLPWTTPSSLLSPLSSLRLRNRLP